MTVAVLEERRTFRIRIYERAIAGDAVAAIAAVLRCTQRSVRAELSRLVRGGFLTREGDRFLARGEPPHHTAQRAAHAREITAVDVLRHRLQVCAAEAATVKSQIESTHACDRATLHDLWDEGRSIVAEARALRAVIVGLEARRLTAEEAERLLENARRSDTSERRRCLDLIVVEGAVDALFEAREQARALFADFNAARATS